MRMWQRVRAVGLATVLVAGGLVGVTLPAGAATGQSHPTVSFRTTLTNKSGGAGSELRSLSRSGIQDVIYCGGTVTLPYVVGGKVEVDVEASCTDIVDSIKVGAALAAGSTLVASNIVESGPTDHNGVSASYPCPGYSVAWAGAGAAQFTKAGYANSPLVLT